MQIGEKPKIIGGPDSPPQSFKECPQLVDEEQVIGEYVSVSYQGSGNCMGLSPEETSKNWPGKKTLYVQKGDFTALLSYNRKAAPAKQDFTAKTMHDHLPSNAPYFKVMLLSEIIDR